MLSPTGHAFKIFAASTCCHFEALRVADLAFSLRNSQFLSLCVFFAECGLAVEKYVHLGVYTHLIMCVTLTSYDLAVFDSRAL